MKDPGTLAILMTDRCSASCRMCCYGSTPESNKLLDEAVIKNWIEQAAETNSFRNIAFSGGEAMMFYEQLKSCVNHAHKYGFNVTLVTNGFWAKNYDKGHKLMADLHEAGLRQVSISIDKFHQEYVLLETQRNAIKILKSLGLLSSITCMETKDGAAIGGIWDNLRPEIYGVNINVYPVFAAGAARSAIDEDQYIRLLEAKTAVCPFPNDLIVLFDGTLMPCCSQFSHEIPFLNLGNCKTTTLAEAIARRKQNDFMYILLLKGFGWFITRAEELGYGFPEKYTIACELCYDIFANEELYEKLKPIVKKEADKIRVAKVLEV